MGQWGVQVRCEVRILACPPIVYASLLYWVQFTLNPVSSRVITAQYTVYGRSLVAYIRWSPGPTVKRVTFNGIPIRAYSKLVEAHLDNESVGRALDQLMLSWPHTIEDAG